jgi:hypothetical protein
MPLPADAQPTAEFGAQGGLVDAVGGLGVLEQQPTIQRRAAAVGRLEDVDQDRVAVELGVAFAGAAMRELRAQEPQLRAVLPVDAVAAEPRDTRMRGEEPTAASTAAACASHTCPRVSSDASAHSAEIDLGGENVTSHAATRFARGFNNSPVDGSTPSRTARKSAAATCPDRPRCSANPPCHTPGASP